MIHPALFVYTLSDVMGIAALVFFLLIYGAVYVWVAFDEWRRRK